MVGRVAGGTLFCDALTSQTNFSTPCFFVDQSLRMFPPVDCGPRTRGRRGGDRRGVGETTVHGMSSFPKDKDTARRSLNFSPSTLSLLAASTH